MEIIDTIFSIAVPALICFALGAFGVFMIGFHRHSVCDEEALSKRIAGGVWDELHRLSDIEVDEVSLVDKGAKRNDD